MRCSRQVRWRPCSSATSPSPASCAPSRPRTTRQRSARRAPDRNKTAHLARLGAQESEQQKERLSASQVQARFALATMYDRAANPDPARSAPPAPVQKGTPNGGPTEGQGAAAEPPSTVAPP